MRAMRVRLADLPVLEQHADMRQAGLDHRKAVVDPVGEEHAEAHRRDRAADLGRSRRAAPPVAHAGIDARMRRTV
jgi:hypothetical protein